MLEGRLKRRISELKLSSYHEYCEYLFDGHGHDAEEMVQLIDAVTTNKTDFFREKPHFDLLVSRVLPELAARGKNRELLIWSAGCSTGEEPYTLAIVDRIRALASRIPLPHSGHRYLDGRASQGRARCFHVGGGQPG